MSSRTRRKPHHGGARPHTLEAPATQHATPHKPTVAALRTPAHGARKGTGAARRRLARTQQSRTLLKIGAALVLGVAVLAVIFMTNNRSGTGASAGLPGQYRFDVANPATGAMAPDFALPATNGSTVRLSDYRGKSVLLFFQEGIGCQGCWTQIKDIEAAMPSFAALGVTEMVSITTNPLNALKQKAADEGLRTPVLADESFAVSRAYNATQYGMMAGSADGHTFILVGPDGRIRWRADYGGPPEYTMYVPVSNLVADIKAGIRG